MKYYVTIRVTVWLKRKDAFLFQRNQFLSIRHNFNNDNKNYFHKTRLVSRFLSVRFRLPSAELLSFKNQ